jgi:hypothetical protein
MDEARLRDEEAARNQGHAPDCPYFATVYPWRCACRHRERPTLIAVDYSEIEKRLLAIMTTPPDFAPRKFGKNPALGMGYGTGRYRK